MRAAVWFAAAVFCGTVWGLVIFVALRAWS